MSESDPSAPAPLAPWEVGSEAVGVTRAAKVLGVDPQLVYRLVHNGRLPAFWVGCRIRIAKVDLIAFRKKYRVSEGNGRDE